MAIRKVARLGHPVLRAPCRELTPAEIRSESVQRLIEDMHDTMVEYGGIGIAAPQVHESVRLALLELEHESDDGEVEVATHVVINPRMTVLDEEQLGHWEGCLSVPDMRGFVERPRAVRVDYLNEDAEPVSIEAEGFLATVFQHELDHLDGIVYVDKISDPTRFAFVQEFSRYHQDGDEEETD